MLHSSNFTRTHNRIAVNAIWMFRKCCSCWTRLLGLGFASVRTMERAIQPTYLLTVIYLLQYGRIVSLDLKTPPRPPAFAFIEFEDPR